MKTGQKDNKSEISKAQRCHLSWFKCTCTGKRWGRVHCSCLASRLSLQFVLPLPAQYHHRAEATLLSHESNRWHPKQFVWVCLADYTAWYRFIIQVGTTISDHICSTTHSCCRVSLRIRSLVVWVGNHRRRVGTLLNQGDSLHGYICTLG